MSDKISVIVPCYNREKYIKECVESLINQDYPLSDTELIFVDDASSDGTMEILKFYEETYPDSILIITNDVNSGYAGRMRNIGLQYATGLYVTFVDSDDRVSRDYLSVLYKKIRETGADVVAGSSVMVNDEGKELSKINKINRVYDVSDTGDFQALLAAEEKNGAVWGKLYSAEFIRSNAIRCEETIHISEDYYFSMQCFFKANKYCTFDKEIYYYRRNEDGLFFDKRSIEYLPDIFVVQVKLHDLYLSRKEEIWTLVEWFYYESVLIARRKAYNAGLTEYYERLLPKIKKLISSYVPGMKKNRFVLQQQNDESAVIYEELFGKRPYLVDILIPSAKQGGPENIINMFGKYCEDKSIRIRVIQMVYGGFNWAIPNIDFNYIYPEGIDQNNNTFLLGYAGFLSEREKPDLILATAWPFLSYVAGIVKNKLKLSCQVVSWLHASIAENEKAGYGGCEALAYADMHLAISEQVKNEIIEACPKGIIVRINNPVSKNKVHKKPNGYDSLKLAYIGRVSAIKRLDILIQAVIRAKGNWNVSIIGDGENMTEIREMIEKNGISDRISLFGWMEDPWEKAIDAAFTILSSDYDCYPMSVIESLANGVPVLAAHNGGVDEIIRNGYNGYFFEKGNVDSLTKLLDEISSGKKRRPISEACIESVKENEEDIAMDNFYNTILKSIITEEI